LPGRRLRGGPDNRPALIRIILIGRSVVARPKPEASETGKAAMSAKQPTAFRFKVSAVPEGEGETL
jgi:hypothetical protein